MGLMTGKVIMSEKDNISTINEDANLSSVETYISTLVELASCDEGLIQLRGGICNLDLLQTCVNYCLLHFYTSMNWQ